MARPQLASDEDILSAAERVLVRLGGHYFSIAAVAEELKLSRAAIILRFKSTEALREIVVRRMVQAFVERMDAINEAPGGNALLLIADRIGAQIGKRGRSAGFFAGDASANGSPMMRELARIRGETLSRAIGRAMPKLHIDEGDAISLFSAHLAGSVLAWQNQENADPQTFLVERTRKWLDLVRIPYDTAYAQALNPAGASPSKAATKKSAAKKRTTKKTRS